MSVEVVSIGNELLYGFTVNSNASLIGQTLLARGFAVERVTLLPDVAPSIRSGIKEAMNRGASFILTTGGLGPTGDDLTREVVAEVCHAPLTYNRSLADTLTQRFPAKPPYILKNQSMMPRGAAIITNPIGTASGWILETREARIIALPGVPSQVDAMLPQVISYLEVHCEKTRYVKALYFCQISEDRIDPLLRSLEKEYPDVQIGICPSYDALSIFICAKSANYLDSIAEKIIFSFSSNFFSTTSRKIEVALQEWMSAHQKTLICAESCTGGHLSARLTANSGASTYFLGGIVSYSNLLKQSTLHVSPETLKAHGAVSREVVSEMARGALDLGGADYAIAISGIAGPSGGSREKPVGTVWGAIGTTQQIFTGKFFLQGEYTREQIIDQSSTFFLTNLWLYLKHHIEPFL